MTKTVREYLQRPRLYRIANLRLMSEEGIEAHLSTAYCRLAMACIYSPGPKVLLCIGLKGYQRDTENLVQVD